MHQSTVLEKVHVDRLKCRWLRSDLADLEKYQTLSLLLMVDFLCIFKIHIFL